MEAFYLLHELGTSLAIGRETKEMPLYIQLPNGEQACP